MPMLEHADHVEGDDARKEWLLNPEHKRGSVAGDDRYPAWTWITHLYHDNDFLTIPAECLAACAMRGATEVPTGKRGKSFKELSQSAILWPEFHYPLLIRGRTIAWPEIEKLLKVEGFAEHKAAVEKLGFSLFVKRVRVGMSKHVRVRARFDDWSVVCEAHLMNPAISKETLRTILAEAGRLKGLGDWRPGARTPGQFGTFKAIVE
jgi:hypothetical protein